MKRTEKHELAKELYRDIKDSLGAVNRSREMGLKDERLDEMARNAAQVIILKLDIVQMEEACPICGSCPICGKREEHEH
jgi:alcohol dehydrogenase class IV